MSHLHWHRGDRLPLPLPLAMLIDPVNACNFRCSFCPTGNLDLLKSINRPRGSMSLSQCKKIIDDIAVMVSTYDTKLKRLGFYKDGEPLLNRELEAMITYACKCHVADSLYLTTNAALLTPERAVKLIDSGLDEIRISVEGTTSEDYKSVTKTFDDYDKILQNVGFLFREKTASSQETKQKYLHDFEPISDMCNIVDIMGWSNADHETFTNGIQINTLCQQQVCPDPFSKLSVNFDMTVSICCVDWSHGTVIGDLSKNSLEEIWYGEPLKIFRIKHLKGERHSIPACENCHYLQTMPPNHVHGMDEHASALLSHFE